MEETYKHSGDFRILGPFFFESLRDAILKAFLKLNSFKITGLEETPWGCLGA